MAKLLPDGYLENLECRNDAFYRVLEGEDDLGMVIRAHIHIEHELREFILAAAPRPTEVKFSDYDFTSTLKLALTLGLNPEFKAALTALGTLRNKFAHRLDMKLTEQEAKQIYQALSAEVRAEAHKGWSSMLLNYPESADYPKNMLKAAPKVLIATCMAMLRVIVVYEHVRLRARAALHAHGAGITGDAPNHGAGPSVKAD